VRLKSVGEVSVPNTHPFQRGRWVFAHNGTIEDLAPLRARVSAERRAEVHGETDSELLFAYLLTLLDAAGVTDQPAGPATDDAIAAALPLLHTPGLGACNFLLADGDTCYAHRLGRTLFLLERTPSDAVRVHRESSETGAVLDTPWSQGRRAVLIASENLTEEPWQSIDERTLLRVDRLPRPAWRRLA